MYRHTGLTRAHKVKSYTIVHHAHACTMRRLTVYTHTERYIYVCVPRDGAMGRDGTGRTDGRDERTMFSSFVFCCIPRVFSFSSVSLFPSLFIHTYTCNFSSTLISLAYILVLVRFLISHCFVLGEIARDSLVDGQTPWNEHRWWDVFISG